MDAFFTPPSDSLLPSLEGSENSKGKGNSIEEVVVPESCKSLLSRLAPATTAIATVAKNIQVQRTCQVPRSCLSTHSYKKDEVMQLSYSF